MKIYLEKNILENLNNHLIELNKGEKIPNDFIRIQKEGNEYIVHILADKKRYNEKLGLYDSLFFNNALKVNIFDKRNNFIARVYKDYIEVFTSAELHLHTGYSLLDGMIKVKDIASKSDYACAITDHGVMYGCIDFFKKMKENHKKPIIGFEAYTENIDGDRYKKNRANRNVLINNHLILLAKNTKGYQNLCKINSLAQKSKAENSTSRPRVEYEWLREYSEGIICLTACLGGELPKAILSKNDDEIKRVIENFIDIFGKENLYLEIQRHHIQEEEYVSSKMRMLAKEYGLKLVATVDAHYLNEEDKLTHEAQLCLQTSKKMTDSDRWIFPGDGYYYHTANEKEELFSDYADALINTLEVVDRCQFEYEFGQYKLPNFPLPEGVTEGEYLSKLCWDGFAERFPVGSVAYGSKEYKERLQFEIDTIIKMGYPSYFLIVWDFIKFAKDNKIAVGPGRGSACGSLASYCLKITDMNPIPYELLFERFLNPDRISMPDIDIDFNDQRREEVINYCREKYGADAVSKIITFGTLASKNSVLDTARVWDKSTEFARSISDKIPSAPKMTIKKALEESIELKEMYDNNPEAKDIIDKAMKIEGLPRNISQHACGLIISNSAVTDYCPQVYVKNKDTGLYEGTTQFTMGECEDIGLLKMDFLGLKTMTVMQFAVDDINEKYGLNLTIDNIPINDPKVYEYIAKGYTKGVFQLEGEGMTKFMTDLFQDVHSKLVALDRQKLSKKEKEEAYSTFGAELFERVIAGISLYRPGPIHEIPNYIKGMLDKNSIKYDTPELENVLKTTYGVIVYQEQAMTTTRELAGFSKGQADTIRKGMAKKKEEILTEYGQYFVYGSADVDKYIDEDKKLNIKGCVALGIDEEKAKIIWEKMRAFGEYAFNKSHAGGYATISIKTAWLAYYYPEIFVKANLNVYIQKPDKVKAYLADAYKRNMKMLPPSVNKSDRYFEVDGENAIRFGLKGIKNVGATSDLIIREREARGEFKSYQDFVERIILHENLKKNVLESLILAGALDEFEGSRRAKYSIIEKIMSSSKVDKKAFDIGQITMFDLADSLGCSELRELKEIKTPILEEFDKKSLLEAEKEYNGYYITEHPLDSFKDILIKENIIPLTNIVSINDEDDDDEIINSTMDDEDNNKIINFADYNNEIVKIAGVVREVEIKYTRKGKPYKTFILEDTTAEVNCKLFKMEANSELIRNGERLIIVGRFQDNEFGKSVVVNNVSDLSIMGNLSDEIIVIGSNDVLTARKQWRDLKAMALLNQGDVSIRFSQNGNKHLFPVKIKLNPQTLSKIQRIFGENNCDLAS